MSLAKCFKLNYDVTDFRTVNLNVVSQTIYCRQLKDNVADTRMSSIEISYDRMMLRCCQLNMMSLTLN